VDLCTDVSWIGGLYWVQQEKYPLIFAIFFAIARNSKVKFRAFSKFLWSRNSAKGHFIIFKQWCKQNFFKTKTLFLVLGAPEDKDLRQQDVRIKYTPTRKSWYLCTVRIFLHMISRCLYQAKVPNLLQKNLYQLFSAQNQFPGMSESTFCVCRIFCPWPDL